jgi:hypothetical protein
MRKEIGYCLHTGDKAGNRDKQPEQPATGKEKE